MNNTVFCVSFLEDNMFAEITISGDIEELFDFQTKSNIFPQKVIFADENVLVGLFSKDNGGKIVKWLQKNGAKYQK